MCTPRGVFDELQTLHTPEKPPWRGEEKCPNTSAMIEKITSSKKQSQLETEDYEWKIKRLKANYILGTNVAEGQGTQTLGSTIVALEKPNSKSFTDDERVSRNLMEAINYLEDRNEEGINKSLLDVEECILDTHKILMKGLLQPEKVGEFTTNPRHAEFEGKIREFPVFETKEQAFDEVQIVVTNYNSTMEYIRTANLSPSTQTDMYFRCAAWLLCKFVTLHPFSDGNGRMCRLLASRCLNHIFPFPCPIYNIHAQTTREDYLKAIMKAQSSDGKDLGDLVALLVESGWKTFENLHTPTNQQGESV